MRMRYSVAMTAVLGVPSAFAADLSVKVELPRLTAAEYHKPYVAIWVERADQSFAANLAVWYQIKGNKDEGHKWLKDMRQWWRKSGRELQMPVDGISGATRAPGEHTLTFSGAKSPLDKLPAGEYVVAVEAAREAGGRELIRVPFTWPPTAAASNKGQGAGELGGIVIATKP